MPDTLDDRARRVETILETQGTDKAGDAWKQELSQVTNPTEQAIMTRALKDANDRANAANGNLPNVDIVQDSEWWSLGLVKKDTSHVEFSHPFTEQISGWFDHANHSYNPFQIVSDVLSGDKK